MPRKVGAFRSERIYIASAINDGTIASKIPMWVGGVTSTHYLWVGGVTSTHYFFPSVAARL